MLDQRLLQIHRLNTVATYVWMACDGQQSARSIARGLERNFEVDGETALRDVNVALRMFATAGLLEPEAAEAAPHITKARPDDVRTHRN